MATREVTVKGEAYWAKVREGQEDMGFEQAYKEFGGCYTIELDLDKENHQKLKDARSGVRRNSNDRFRFKRKKIEKFDWLPGGTPSVTLGGEPFKDIIPNGSVVEVDLTVYDTAYNPGTRLEAVRILSLAEMPEESKPETEKEEMPF